MSDVGSFFTATIARQLKGMSDAVVERNELLKMLNKKGRVRYGLGGDTIKFRIYVSEPSVGGSTTDWAQRAASTIQPYVVAEETWAQYDWSIIMSEFQKMRNKNAGPEAKMFDQFAMDLAAVKQSAISRIGRHAYNGTGTTYTGDQGTSIKGLVDIVSNSGTYAGLSRTTYPAIKSQVASISNPEVDTTGNDVPELLEGLRSLYLDCSGGVAESEDKINDQMANDKAEPDFGITTKAIFLNYDNCLYPTQRFTNAADKDPQTNLLFYGLPVLWDTFCPSGKFFLLNSKYLNFDCTTDMIITAGQEADLADRNAHVWKFLAQCQMYSRNPRYHGVATIS